MTGDGRPIYCWDTTVFLAWLNEETTAPLADIAQVVLELDRFAAVLIVPVTIETEVLESHMTPEQSEKFERFLLRTNIIKASITSSISRKARQIRDAGLAMTPKRKLKTPDSQIIATAIIHKCDSLHSLDDGALRLNGTAAVDHLRIERPIPFSGQRGLL